MRWIYLILASMLVATGIIFLLQLAAPEWESIPVTPPVKKPVSQEVEKNLEHARQLAKSGDWSEAIRTLKRLRDADPKLVDTYLEAGRIYLGAGQVDQAVEEWKQGIQRAGEDPALLSALGMLHLQAKADPLAAMVFFKKAEKIDPNFPGLKSSIGETLGFASEKLLQKEDKEGAKKAMEEALKVDANSVSALRTRAHLAEGEARWQDAAADWEKIFSISSTPESRVSLAEAHKRCGFIRLTKKDKDGAILHFRRTVDLAAEGVGLESILDLLQQEAKSALEEGVKAFDVKEYAKARERFSYSASLLPENPIAQNHLGLTLLKEGDREAAAQAWETCIAQAKKADFDLGATPTHKNLVLLYGELKRDQDRDRVIQDYLTKFPKGPYAAELLALTKKP